MPDRTICPRPTRLDPAAWIRVLRAALAATTVACALCTTAPALAQNALSNGRFDLDDGVDGWFGSAGVQGTVFEYDPDVDATEKPSSGSLRLSNNHPSVAGIYVSFFACMPLLEAKERYFVGRARFAPGQTPTGQLDLQMTYHATGTCSGNSLAGTQLGSVDTSLGRGIWHVVKWGNITAGLPLDGPPASLLLTGRLKKNEAGGILTVNFDDAFIGNVGEPLCNGLVPTIGGTDSAEEIFGTSAPDVIVGLGDDDVIKSAAGDDTVCGGLGNDLIAMGKGADWANGGGGNDTLQGGQGDDVLYGGTGNDSVKGNDGSDHVNGSSGTDACNGGVGSGDTAAYCETVSGVP